MSINFSHILRKTRIDLCRDTPDKLLSAIFRRTLPEHCIETKFLILPNFFTGICIHNVYMHFAKTTCKYVSYLTKHVYVMFKRTLQEYCRNKILILRNLFTETCAPNGNLKETKFNIDFPFFIIPTGFWLACFRPIFVSLCFARLFILLSGLFLCGSQMLVYQFRSLHSRLVPILSSTSAAH